MLSGMSNDAPRDPAPRPLVGSPALLAAWGELCEATDDLGAAVDRWDRARVAYDAALREIVPT